MVTNYPQGIAAPVMGATTESQTTGGFARAMIRLRQFICGLHGHDPMLHFDHQRMSLECATCGFETPGWELDGRRPRPVFRGDPQHHLLYRPTAVRTGPRRVA